MTKSINPNDPGYCGLGNLNTGPYDPYQKEACTPHDNDFEKMINLQKHPSLSEVNADWVVNTSKVMLKGAYAVATFPLYLVGGLVGGTVRWFQWKLRGKQ